MPSHQPTQQTRRTVESMSAYGIPQPDIARVIGVCQETLTKYYRDELDLATAKANSKVAETLYKQATDAANPRSALAAIFWLKTRGKWTETVSVLGPGPNGEHMHKVSIDPDRLSDAALEEIIGAMNETPELHSGG